MSLSPCAFFFFFFFFFRKSTTDRGEERREERGGEEEIRHRARRGYESLGGEGQEEGRERA